MKRTLCTLALLLALTPAVSAQEHQHQHADTTKAIPMERGGMMDHDGMMSMEDMMPQMMRMHEHVMADSALHRMMMSDPEMRQMMAEMMGPMMGGEMDMATMRQRMAEASPEERQQMMERMHAQMMERMGAMEPDERHAMMERMMQMHQRVMADPAMHERMMANPEMRQMMEEVMERMHEGGMMDHDGMMDHEGMNHGEMHEQMHEQMHGEDGMDHGAMMDQRSGNAEREAAASALADRFHAALVAGDRAAVEGLLLPDVVVLEGGRAETRTEYLGGHFGSDAAFLAALEWEPLTRRTTVAGNAAWVASTSRLRGTPEGRALDLDSAELLVLRNTPEGWRIAAVHWSSSDRR